MKSLILSLAFLASASVSNAAIIIDNYIGQQNGEETGAVGSFLVQSFTPSTAGLGANDTVAANSPLPATVLLQSATFLHALTGPEPALGDVYIDVYEGDGDDGIYIGSSLNAVDVASTAPLATLTWNFANLELDSTLEYGLVFSADAIAGSPKPARLQVARDAGGGVGNSYSGGTADNNSHNNSPVAFDARFTVTMAVAVPEPSSIALAGLAIAGLFIRCRRG